MVDETLEGRAVARFVDGGDRAPGKRRAGADMLRQTKIVARRRDASDDRPTFRVADHAHPR
jgi:hypothetical protein